MLRPTASALALALALALTAQAHAQPMSSPGRFMAQNAQQAGVTTLPSGLQYKVVESGPPGGAQPHYGDRITVDYEGRLVSGQVFDSTYARGKPSVMQLVRLIRAWEEALPLMHVGDEWMLYVPPSLGYGDEQAGPIPPNSVLIFRIKLISIG
jgi:peptidylprolyl isomerase/FKBP-type peptidyl-prolyl cis-trans isomerase FklB